MVKTTSEPADSQQNKAATLLPQKCMDDYARQYKAAIFIIQFISIREQRDMNKYNVWILLAFLYAGHVLADVEIKKERVFIFGYGSLMNTVARTATAPDPEGGRFIPVRIKGYKRGWNLWAASLGGGMRVLGAEKEQGTYMNGLIYEVSAADLPKFDKRENPQAYQRAELPADAIEFYNKADARFFAEQGTSTAVYIYLARDNDLAKGGLYLTASTNHKDKYVYRSYLDVVITGCQEVDNNHNLRGAFFEDCSKTLSLNDLVVKNDLMMPKYPRHPKALLSRKKEELEYLQNYLEQDWPGYLQEVDQLLEKLGRQSN